MNNLTAHFTHWCPASTSSRVTNIPVERYRGFAWESRHGIVDCNFAIIFDPPPFSMGFTWVFTMRVAVGQSLKLRRAALPRTMGLSITSPNSLGICTNLLGSHLLHVRISVNSSWISRPKTKPQGLQFLDPIYHRERVFGHFLNLYRFALQF